MGRKKKKRDPEEIDPQESEFNEEVAAPADGIPLPPFPEVVEPPKKIGRPTLEDVKLRAQEAEAQRQAQEFARLAPSVQEAKGLVDVAFAGIAGWRGEAWRLTETEIDMLGNAIGPVLAKYPTFGGAYRVEIGAALALGGVVFAKYRAERLERNERESRAETLSRSPRGADGMRKDVPGSGSSQDASPHPGL